MQVKQTVSAQGSVQQDERGVLALAATAENYSEHPLAKAIMAHAKGAGIEPVMVTGDNIKTAEEVACRVGIEKVHAQVLPSGKVDVISELRKQG